MANGTLSIKARLALPSLFQPFGGDESNKYNACFILEAEKHEEELTKVKKEIQRVMQEKWGGNIKSPKQLKQMCLHSGEEKAQYAGFEGNMYVSASNKTAPTVVDRDGRTKLVERDGRPYSGCYVIAYLQLWAQDNRYGKGVNATLRGVQFYEDGEPFAGAPPMDLEEFEELDPLEPELEGEAEAVAAGDDWDEDMPF